MPKFLFKANDDVLSFCKCVGEPAKSTCQLECPWCGCGWLFSCSKCDYAFTFAVVRETDVSLVEMGKREFKARGLAGEVGADELARWADDMAEALDCFEVGEIVVYLDGSYWNVNATDVAFDGYFSTHKLDRLPHAEALADPPRLHAILGDKKYWLSRERPDREIF